MTAPRALGRAGRLARTLRRAHPLQVVARPVRVLGGLIPDVPGAGAPAVDREWPEAPAALRRFARQERDRGRERLARLPAASHLRAYEVTYGLECGDDDASPRDAWRTRTAVEPYPASVRARRLAVAARLGAPGARHELARAARAVLLRPEVHLLGNHLLENGFGLACAGAVARGAEADLWWHAGVALLGWQLEAQFLADGGHVERSASYHVALLAGLLEAIELADASGRGAPAGWRAVAERAASWSAAVRAPDGTYPLFNDAALDAAPSIRDVLALARDVGIAVADPAAVPRAGDTAIVRLEPTGWVRVDGADGACLFVDAGPDADGWQPGHAHADGLTFELWVAGARAVVDFGVASYEVDDARARTRATRSHNTVEVDGLDSCEVWSAFRVGRRGRGRVVSAERDGGCVRLRLEHDGYRWLAGAPSHVRTMTVRPGALEVHDEVVGGAHALVSRLRLAEGAVSAVHVETAGANVERAPGAWHARHGEPLPAVVFTQRATTADAAGVTWRLTW